MESKQFLPNNKNFKVFTQDGYKSFLGLLESVPEKILSLYFADQTSLNCTLDHKILGKGGFREAKDFVRGDRVKTGKGGYKKVIYREVNKNVKGISVFDLVEVEDTHSFIGNGTIVANCLILDEYAFVPTYIAEEFFRSVFPTISSGETTKIIITSTPNGMNQFYKMWIEANHPKNSKDPNQIWSGYYPMSISWKDVPKPNGKGLRDEQWKKDTIAATSETAFRQEFESVSTDTIITLKDTLTNDLIECPIGELYEQFEKYFIEGTSIPEI